MRSMFRCMTSTSTIGIGVSTLSTRRSRTRWSRCTAHSSVSKGSLVDAWGGELGERSYAAVQIIWISTGVFAGSPATPIAVRACRPFSPSTSMSSSTGRVGDPRLQPEVRRAGHEDQHLHDPDPVQVSHRLHGGGEAVQDGMAGELARRLELDIAADNPLPQQHTVLVGQLPRDVDAGVHGPMVDVVRVVSEAGKLQTKGLEPLP